MERFEATSKDIVVDKQKLSVRKFETSDKDIVSYFQELDPRIRRERLEHAIRTGVIALKTVVISERMDYVKKEFMQMNNEFNDSVDEAATVLEQKLEAVFGEEGQFSEVVKAQFGENGEVVKEIFNPSKEGSPLNILRNEIRNEISSLKTELKLDSLKNQIEKKTPLKGAKFEEVCEHGLTGIAQYYGDIVERTTDVAGSLRPSKKGDFVVELASSSRKIVFEVKDRDNGLSQPAILTSMKESIQNRDASYGVYVVKFVESLPQGVGWFNEYEGDKLVCALGTESNPESLHEEMLQIAYKWAKFRVTMEALKERSVDSAYVRDRITEIQAKLHGLSKVKNDCTSIEASTKDIRRIVDELQTRIDSDLSEILKSLSVAS